MACSLERLFAPEKTAERQDSKFWEIRGVNFPTNFVKIRGVDFFSTIFWEINGVNFFLFSLVWFLELRGVCVCVY